MNKAVPKPALAPPVAQADPDLVSLSKRMTKRAAASMRDDAPTAADLGKLSLDVEADHIQALRRYIASKEAVVSRFREQLSRFRLTSQRCEIACRRNKTREPRP